VLGFWAAVYGWANCFSVLLNAVNCLDRQVQLLVGAAIVNLPLSFVLGSRMGSTGVALAGLLVIIPLAISNAVQCFNVLRQGEFAPEKVPKVSAWHPQ
jgi:Na+-driven multidrug efflux pump